MESKYSLLAYMKTKDLGRRDPSLIANGYLSVYALSNSYFGRGSTYYYLAVHICLQQRAKTQANASAFCCGNPPMKNS